MIGNINIYSGKNGYDPIEASGEMGAAVYAFDISIDTPYDAYTLLMFKLLREEHIQKME